MDFLVIGAGVAGLRAALELAEHGTVLVVTKEAVRESNTHYAQGGIAVAMEGDEDVALHLKDTVAAGDGLVNRAAAETLVREGPLRVAELIEWGAQFDRNGGALLRTREAAHSRPRILHANGDATGAEIGRALAGLARIHKRIQFAEWTTVTKLVVVDERVSGVDLLDPNGAVYRMAARAVLVAAGGAGQLYEHTTNPAVATGDGIALASRAGAALQDMEFYQFHPTALSLPGVPAFLLSEALRGEGAWLRNGQGERFMERYDARLELAPRDVVARAVWREGVGATGETRPVYLDMRHVTGVDLHQRFPGISAFLAKHGLDLHRDLIPVRPAAHYLMGGVRTDLDGCTNVRGLFAAGEAACTGLHGANRLASNSLLEGLVFGARAARAMLADSQPLVKMPEPEPAARSEASVERVEAIVQEVRKTMDRCAGLLRDEAGLRVGLASQASCAEELDRIARQSMPSRQLVEAQSLCAVAEAILRSALVRTESRGAHYRTDYPKRDDERFRKHSVYERGEAVRFEVE
jgi:L-aspartate oxidase